MLPQIHPFEVEIEEITNTANRNVITGALFCQIQVKRC